MSISVNPIVPAIAIQAAAPDLVLQPGSVIDAQVLKVLADNLVRIAISGISIDVLTEIPLSAGQALQLAVSQTPDGVRLAVVGQAPGAAAGTSRDVITLAPAALVDAAANPPVSVAPSRNELTPLERVAVAAAAQSAATQQGSLAPLFANLGVVAASNSLPPQLQQAVMQLLAQRTSLDQNLTGSDVKNAVQKSGLFLEASLASESVSSVSGMPDLKAALIVLRQTLLSALGAGDSPAASATVAKQLRAAATSTLAPEIDLHEILLPQGPLPVADGSLEAGGPRRVILAATLLDAAPRAATVGAALNLLQESPREIGNASLTTATPGAGRNDDVTVHTSTPPPPFRGALPSAQPVASPSIAPDAPLATTAHHLLSDTDAAIARQTLLQVASLPDRVDIASARTDPTTPRWNFEIPFATPQGTAMAQFEISRDGGGGELEAAKRGWRARLLPGAPGPPVRSMRWYR